MTKAQNVRSKKKVKDRLPAFDKYAAYIDSVQSPEADVEFFSRVYSELREKPARVLREDFCGSFALCCEWVKLGEENKAIGIDIDQEPLEYGKSHHLVKLSREEQERVSINNISVLSGALPVSDIAVALNFSYFCFKDRAVLKEYLSLVRDSLDEQGLLFLDCFGGSKCHEANEEETEFTDRKFSYFWDQDSFDPVSHDAKFYIHFKRKGEKKREKVFAYDWRMWTIPELRDLLIEVGFSSTHVYWEGNDEEGEGNGIFEKVARGEECEAWVAYIVAEK